MATSIAASGSAGRQGDLWGQRPQAWGAIEEQQRPTYEEGIRRAGLKAGDRVLDVGCGTGVFLRAVTDMGGRAYGLDASRALLRVARARVPEADLRVGDAESLPHEDDSFDLVTGFNSFFFADDMVAALREAGRVAKPGAPVLVQVWGRPERCDLTPMLAAVGSLRPPQPEPRDALASALGARRPRGDRRGRRPRPAGGLRPAHGLRVPRRAHADRPAAVTRRRDRGDPPLGRGGRWRARSCARSPPTGGRTAATGSRTNGITCSRGRETPGQTSTAPGLPLSTAKDLKVATGASLRLTVLTIRRSVRHRPRSTRQRT